MANGALNTKSNLLSTCLFIFAIGASVFSIVLGLVVVTGWFTGNATLIQILPLFVPMQFNTALGFILCGSGMLLDIFKSRYSTIVIGILIIIVGGLTLLEYLTGLNLFIDELFMKHTITVKTSHPGRMAPNTATCFVLIGSILTFSTLFRKSTYQSIFKSVLVSLVLGLSIVALFGYIIQLETAYGWGSLTRMAVHTSIGFVVLSVGYLIFTWCNDLTDGAIIPRWLPVLTAIGTLSVAICFWQAVQSEFYKIGEQNDLSTGFPHFPTTGLIAGVLLAIALTLSAYLAYKREVLKTKQALTGETSRRMQAEDELTVSQEMLIQAEKLAMVGKLSSGIAHEIRNPLSAISASAYYLKEKLKDADEKTKSHLDRINNQVNISNDIIQDMQNLTQMRELTMAQVDIAVAVADGINSSKVPQTVNVINEVPDGEFIVTIDTKQASIVFKNILANAIEAMDNEGTIRITAHQSGDKWVDISFQDSGPDITQENLNKVFQPFFSTKTSGFGFGLALCKTIMEKHGGEIEAHSEAGKDTTFIVRFPC